MGRANKTHGGVQVFCTPHDCKTKFSQAFSVSVKKLEGCANKTYGGELLFCTPHDCKTKFSQVLASALKNLRVVQTKHTAVCKYKARPILVLLKLFNHNKKNILMILEYIDKKVKNVIIKDIRMIKRI